MLKFYASISFALLLLCTVQNASAQCNNVPCTSPMPNPDAAQACVSPSPGALSCYYGSTSNTPIISLPPSWCTTVENNVWFAFVADATTASFSLSVYGCATGSGIQAAVLSTQNCANFNFVSPCLGNIPTNTTTTLTTNQPLTIGETYFLMIDGTGGAFCDYSINGLVPNITIPPGGVCIPSKPTATYMANGNALWSIDPPTAGTITSPNPGPTATVTWSEAGPAQICAKDPNCPDAPLFCKPVNVGEDIVTFEDVDLCQGKSVDCAGKTYTTGGTFPVTLKTYLNCDSLVNCVVHVIPKVYTTEIHKVCQNQSVECAGVLFGNAGTFPVTLTGPSGCDSIVNCKIQVIPTYISPFKIVNICGPASYTLCSDTYTTSGLYSEVCTSSFGCDSIINVNLAILEPDAVIATPGVLDCTVNKQIVLDGSGSSVNTAVGGQTLYKWSGPGIVGFNNQSKVTVNQPGVYCLIVTHSRAGFACSDTACVTVTAISAVPQVPILSGNNMPCQDSTTIYTATAVGNPAPTSYTWSTPGGVPFTTLTPASISINWTGSVTSGPICVIANNNCGASQPACMTVNVQPAIQIPVLSGPSVVCAGGGNYLYTLNGEQVGTTYNWSVPAGATFTGSGDTIRVNFLNSASGNVCVTPQNFCGTGAAVCKAVSVKPIPTANLAGAGPICAGDSIQLVFSLTGNGPFDVNWFNGSANVDLLDIPNGYTLHLAPTTTTLYQLNGVKDNTTPNACTAPASDAVTATVHPNFAQTKNIQICEGQSLFVGGAAQTATGVYVDSLNTQFGCDSVITTNLTVLQIDSLIIPKTTCDPALAGTVTQTFLQTNGCDSVVTTVTKLLPSNITNLFDKTCIPANVGVFTKHLTNQYGCDSTVIRTVTFSLSDTTLLFKGNCDPAATGTFVQQLLTSEGCDSVVITKVSLLQKDTTYLSASSCNPAQVGVFKTVLTNIFGCDSTIIKTVNFTPLDTTFLTTSSCDPAATGVFTKHITTAGGCDSIVVTTVKLLPSSLTNLTGKSCNPNNVGVFTKHLVNQYGCDSTVITTISFFHLDTTHLTTTTCDPAQAGVFSKTLLTSGGCDSVIITKVNLLPSNVTNLTGSSCNPNKVGIFTKHLTNQFGCDSTVITTISFFHLDTTYLSAASCDPAAVGVFPKTLLTAGGCDSVVITTVSLLPESTKAVAQTTCDPTKAGVFVAVYPNQYGCDSTVTTTVSLLPSSATLLQYTTCDPAQVGSVVKVVPNIYGCDSTITSVTSLLPPNACGVNILVTGSTIPCGATKGNITLKATLGEAPFSFKLLLNGIQVNAGVISALNVPFVVNNLDPGNYTIEVTSPNGFSATSTTTINQVFPPALTATVSSNFNGFGVSCKGEVDGVALATPSGGQAPFTYLWSNGLTGAQVQNLGAGTYTVTINDANQCTNTASVTLTEPLPLKFSFKVNDLTCFGNNNGSIYVEAEGGVPPYRYTLDQTHFQNSNAFMGLKAGQYTVTTFDANDCQRTEIILVNPAYKVKVDLGDDQLINLGDSITLKAIVNVPFDSILSVVWNPSFVNPDCGNCLEQTVVPFISTTYSIKVTAANGCAADDKMQVKVNRRKYVYVPNVFTPGNDNNNAKFSIFAKPGTVKNIRSFQIFDRWGEMVFTQKDFQPNNPEIGWDGKLNGSELSPAVFVWYAEVEFIDGVIELYKGDVTLVR